MKKYKIAVRETCEVIVEVEAECHEDAESMALDAYNKGEIDMGQGDCNVETYLWE